MAKYRERTALTRRPMGGGQGPPPSARLTKYFADQEQQREQQQLQFKAGLATQTAIDVQKASEGREAFRSKYGAGLDIEALPFGETKEHFEVQQEKITSGELGFTSPTLQRRWDTLEQERAMIRWDPRISEDDRRLKLEAIEEGMRLLIKMAKPTREARDKIRAEQIRLGEEAAERGFFIDPETGIPVKFERGGADQEKAQFESRKRDLDLRKAVAEEISRQRPPTKDDFDKSIPYRATKEDVDEFIRRLDNPDEEEPGGVLQGILGSATRFFKAAADSQPKPPLPPPPSGKPAGPQHDDPFKDPQGRRWEPAIQ